MQVIVRVAVQGLVDEIHLSLVLGEIIIKLWRGGEHLLHIFGVEDRAEEHFKLDQERIPCLLRHWLLELCLSYSGLEVLRIIFKSHICHELLKLLSEIIRALVSLIFNVAGLFVELD